MAEVSPTPGSSSAIGSFEDSVANDRMLAAAAAFNHRAMAQEIRQDIYPYTPDEAQQASIVPGASYVVGWLINTLKNIPKRHRAAWHESEARRVEPIDG